MDLALKIVTICGPIIFGTYLTLHLKKLKAISTKRIIIIWIICLLISSAGVYSEIKQSQQAKKEHQEEEYSRQSQRVRRMGL